jgi:hypothetical protein
MRGACGEWGHQQSSVSAQAVARGDTCCASQVLDHGALAIARRAATLSQQEKNNSLYMQRSRENITGFIYTVAR